MPDDSDPIAPPLEGPSLEAKEPRSASGAPEGVIPDRQEPLEKAPARGQGAILGFAASAVVGGVVGAFLVLLLNPAADLSKIEARLTTIESAQVSAAKGVDAAGKRLTALEQANASVAKSADVQTLGQRLDAAEKALAALPATPAPAAPTSAEPAPAAVDLGPIAAQIAALQTKVDALAAKPDATQPLAARLDADEAKIGDLAAKPDPTQPLIGRLAALVAAVAAVKANLNATAADPAAVDILALELARRFDAGQPFAAELDKLKQFGVAADVTGPLAQLAANGAPTVQKLAADFNAATPAVIAAATPADESFVDRLEREASSLVRVHRKGVVEGDSADALASQVAADIAKGDFAAALASFQKLPEKARAAAEPWRIETEARAAGEAAIAKFQAAALAALKPPAP